MRVPPIDRATVARLCDLAQLEVGDAELDRVAASLGAILGYAAELGDVDVEGVAPMDRPFADQDAPLREDVPGRELPVAITLAQAPRSADGAFDVPGFVDEG